MSQNVELDHVSHRFDDFVAVRDVALDIRAGEFFSFLGPSGCGKTTLLRLIAGFIEPAAGRIRIGGRDMHGIGPNRRPTAMIFQNLALFPLMSVADNIAFGLEVRGVDRTTRRRRAEALLELIALPGQGDKRVAELSGGQRQRVAIARALAVEPAVLLLDEPLSALDLKLRQHLRAELRALQRRTGVTFVYITHDQGEALAMSDRVGVMNAGVLQQVAAPEVVYADPATPFVASFVGENNRIDGTVRHCADGRALLDTALGPLVGRCPAALAAGSRAALFVRPERLRPDPAGACDNRLELRVRTRSFEGASVQVGAAGADGTPLTLALGNLGELPALAADSALAVGFAAADATVLAP
ncbi:spermidine/putrescine transport system ATP-binding protein [Plasticicumulans lactativorans]|uniref:Spermidine/putrescine transport system ATP-binding protein n=1 Tax=Plasticicumulans lactativorans TaxID=1133106 RepID=A0A4R2L5S0_9GAMM|nr:ABC transporter ATP-binding protein [Plasticicumulans lactativorans]TCO81185.1 spermidine/putrescine transport system ATP-binding protein [Plasticicumulans lactativorans]